MTQREIESTINSSVIDAIFNGHELNSASGKYVITVRGKIITVNGKAFYDSKEQATRAFYNSFKWRMGNVLSRRLYNDPYRYWRTEDSSAMWKAFKTVLRRDYGFNIVQV